MHALGSVDDIVSNVYVTAKKANAAIQWALISVQDHIKIISRL